MFLASSIVTGDFGSGSPLSKAISTWAIWVFAVAVDWNYFSYATFSRSFTSAVLVWVLVGVGSSPVSVWSSDCYFAFRYARKMTMRMITITTATITMIIGTAFDLPSSSCAYIWLWLSVWAGTISSSCNSLTGSSVIGSDSSNGVVSGSGSGTGSTRQTSAR